MKPTRWKLISALVLFALLLSGCINIQQEYWLNGDGSAKVSMDVGMSQALLSMGSSGSGTTPISPFDDLKKQFSTTNPRIKNVQVREYTDKDMQHFAVTFEVVNFEDFLKTQTSQDGEFNITLSHQSDGSILFKQLTQLDTGSQASGLDAGSTASMFKDMYWTVIVHAPQVLSTNGTKVDNGTVQWKIPMADIIAGKAPSQLTLTYKTTGGAAGGAGWVGWVAGLLVLALIAGGAAYYFLVLRKRPPQAPALISYPPAGGPYAPAPQPGYPPMPPQGFPPAPGQPQPGYPPMPPQGFPPAPDQPQPGYPDQPILPPASPQPSQGEPMPSQEPLLPKTKPLSPRALSPQYPQYQPPQFPPAPPQAGYPPYAEPPQKPPTEEAPKG